MGIFQEFNKEIDLFRKMDFSYLKMLMNIQFTEEFISML